MTLYPKKFQFIYLDQTIECELYPPHPLTKKRQISLSLTNESILKIRAPIKTAHKDILTVLEKHGHWILTHLEKQRVRQEKIKPLRFIQSEQHLFLGQYYPLNIEEDLYKKQNIELNNQGLFITIHHNTPEKLSYLLDSWYRLQAIHYFSDRIHAFRPITPWIQWETPPQLRIKKMKTRWGSYHSKGTGIVTLNQYLIKAPSHCIDYVILHELCHATEPNHGKGFYALLDKVMPNWREYRLELNQKSSLFLDHKSV